ncbi:MAG: hypothetical protein WC614_12965 [bacterium]
MRKTGRTDITDKNAGKIKASGDYAELLVLFGFVENALNGL